MHARKKALFCLTILAGTLIGTSVVGKGSSAYADWDDWGHRGGGYFRGPYQQGGGWNRGGWGGYRPVNYGWGGRPGWGGGWNRGGWGGYGYRPCGGWNRGGWGGGWNNRPWGGWNRGGWGGGWGGGPRWNRGGMW